MFSPIDVTALRMADVILLVAQLELSSLRNVVRMLLTLGSDDDTDKQGQDCTQPRRQRERHQPEEGGRDDRQADFLASAQRSPSSMTEARNQGVPLLMLAPRSKIQAELHGHGAALCGKEMNGPSKAEKTSWIGGIFSRR